MADSDNESEKVWEMTVCMWSWIKGWHPWIGPGGLGGGGIDLLWWNKR